MASASEAVEGGGYVTDVFTRVWIQYRTLTQLGRFHRTVNEEETYWRMTDRRPLSHTTAVRWRARLGGSRVRRLRDHRNGRREADREALG